MTDLTSLPTVVLSFLTAPGVSGPGSRVRAQATRFDDTDDAVTAVLSCALLLKGWEPTIPADGSYAAPSSRDAVTTITMLEGWRPALRDLRVLLADARLDLLLALPGAESGPAEE